MYQVDVNILDNVLLELGVNFINFVKIDVGGAGAKVLEGARKVLRKTRNLIIEVTTKENMYKLAKVLREYGMSLKDIRVYTWASGKSYYNCFWRRS